MVSNDHGDKWQVQEQSGRCRSRAAGATNLPARLPSYGSASPPKPSAQLPPTAFRARSHPGHLTLRSLLHAALPASRSRTRAPCHPAVTMPTALADPGSLAPCLTRSPPPHSLTHAGSLPLLPWRPGSLTPGGALVHSPWVSPALTWPPVLARFGTLAALRSHLAYVHPSLTHPPCLPPCAYPASRTLSSCCHHGYLALRPCRTRSPTNIWRKLRCTRTSTGTSILVQP